MEYTLIVCRHDHFAVYNFANGSKANEAFAAVSADKGVQAAALYGKEGLENAFCGFKP